MECQFVSSGLCINPQGGISPCCVFSGKLEDFSDFQSIYKPSLKRKQDQLKEQFAKGQFPDQCSGCKTNEELGLPSRRTKFFERFELAEVDLSNVKMNDSGTFEDLVFLDFAFSNLCNLACSFCNSQFSSKWVARNGGQLERRRTLSISDWTYFWENTPNLRMIDLKGGEPFMDPGMMPFLESLLAVQRDEIWIVISTNALLVTNEHLKIIESLPSIFLSISVDGLGETYSGIRGTSFENFEEKVHQIMRAMSGRPIGFNFTVCNKNVLNLYEFLKWLQNLQTQFPRVGISAICLQIVHDPAQMSPWNLSHQDLARAIERIDEAANDPKITVMDKGQLRTLSSVLSKKCRRNPTPECN